MDLTRYSRVAMINPARIVAQVGLLLWFTPIANYGELILSLRAVTDDAEIVTKSLYSG